MKIRGCKVLLRRQLGVGPKMFSLLGLSFFCVSCQWLPEKGNLSTGNLIEENLPIALEKPLGLSGKKSFGLYQWDKNHSYQTGLLSDIALLGTQPAYVIYFVDLERGFPDEIIRFNAKNHIKTLVTQELSLYSQGWNDHILPEISAGKWDAYFKSFALSARKFPGTVFYRFGYEMNGDWVAWGEQPTAFKAAWRHVWDLFNREKVHNVKWVWSPNVLWGDRVFEEAILPFYPGERYTDFIGLDGYNFGEHHNQYHTWQSFDQVFTSSIAGMKKYFPKKRLWLTEVGCADDERKAEWIKNFLTAFNKDPELPMFIWFNEDKKYAGEPNWRFDSDQESKSRFRNWAIFSNSITSFSLPEYRVSMVKPLTPTL